MQIKKPVYFSFFVIVTTLSACMTTEGEPHMGNLKPSVPTSKERSYVDTLHQKYGLSKVEYDIPIPGYLAKGGSVYYVHTDCPPYANTTNHDSILQLNKAIANELYRSVIEDSMIVELGEINIDFCADRNKSSGNFSVHYTKVDLEVWNGFKVIEMSPHKYKRIPWTREQAIIAQRKAEIEHDKAFRKLNGLKPKSNVHSNGLSK